MTMRNGGGDDLFRSMYNRYYARMLRYFRRVFHVSVEDAQELTQDSFVRFYRTLAEYRGEAEWALLEKIAQSVGCNRVRSLNTIKRGAVKPESLDDLDHPDNHPKSDALDPVDRMIAAERKTRLRQEIARLPRGQRQCLQLSLEDLSYEEIARVLRVSLDAVKSRIRDAKRVLRERLGDEEMLPEDES
jgi:RNA polymerase sigma-70 factor (ECF subfamily)